MKCTRCNKDYIRNSNSQKYCGDCKVVVYREIYRKASERRNKKVQEKQHSTYQKGKTKCLICGAWIKAPAMHSYQFHGVTAREYKEEFNLPYGKGILPSELKQIKREHVFANKTVENLKRGSEKRFKPGEERVYDGVLRRAELGQTKQPKIV